MCDCDVLKHTLPEVVETFGECACSKYFALMRQFFKKCTMFFLDLWSNTMCWILGFGDTIKEIHFFSYLKKITIISPGVVETSGCFLVCLPLIAPIYKSWKSNLSITKRFLPNIGLRICNFSSKMVENRNIKKILIAVFTTHCWLIYVKMTLPN